MEKRGQMKLSFGMIFSIILIIAFLASGFYGIQSLLDTKDKVQIETFVDGLQKKITEMQKSYSDSSDEVKFFLPNYIEEICFVNEKYNLQIYHNNNIPDERTIKGLNEEGTLNGETGDAKYCIKVENGKVEFLLSKEYGEGGITVSKKE